MEHPDPNGAKLRGIVVAKEVLGNEHDFVSLTPFSAMKLTLDRICVGGLPSLPLETADRTTNGLNLAPFGSGFVGVAFGKNRANALPFRDFRPVAEVGLAIKNTTTKPNPISGSLVLSS